jgi:translation initiation factor 4E
MSQKKNEILLLQYKWILYTDEYFKNMLKIGSFGCIRTFWELFNNVPSPSKLAHRRNYRLFKEHVQPLSEDKSNITGGQWLLSFDSRTKLDAAFLELTLAVVGNTISNDVTGIVVNVRNRMSRLCVWTSYGGKDRRQLDLGKKIKTLVGLHPKEQLSFKLHKETTEKNHSAFQAQVVMTC